MGYSKTEIDDIQARWKLRFPPDLVELLLEHRSLFSGPGSFDWVLSDPAEIQQRLDWPFEGFSFEVQHNQAWWPEWGAKSNDFAEQQRRLSEVFAQIPKLIPLFAHRYLPEEPCERGNPVFSVYQTDIIYYGADLADYIERERHNDRYVTKPWPPIKKIRFW